MIRGRHVFMGYLGELRTTGEVLTSDSWLRSGDLGYLSEVGEAAHVPLFMRLRQT